MAKKGELGLGIGSTSIIMVFVVLCLAIFGVLTLVTADSDYKLTRKTSESITKFYRADSQAEEILAQIDEVLVSTSHDLEESQGWQELDESAQEERYQIEAMSRLEVFLKLSVLRDSGDQIEVLYEVEVDERQTLGIKMQISSYDSFSEERYNLLEWVISPLEEWEYEAIEFEDIKMGK